MGCQTPAVCAHQGKPFLGSLYGCGDGTIGTKLTGAGLLAGSRLS
jgi:hypothetical protein